MGMLALLVPGSVRRIAIWWLGRYTDLTLLAPWRCTSASLRRSARAKRRRSDPYAMISWPSSSWANNRRDGEWVSASDRFKAATWSRAPTSTQRALNSGLMFWTSQRR
jgi:hypothetical protein